MTTVSTPPAIALWEHLYGDIKGHLCVASGTRQVGRLSGFKEAFFAYPLTAELAHDWLQHEARKGRETYFCANLLRDKRRLKENATQVLTLWADGDGADIPADFWQPTAIVESSPDRHHYYWRLTSAIDPSRAEELNRRIAYALGADPSGWDIGQLLRPPGFPNFKYAGVTTHLISGGAS